ncbi:MAG: M23 family metallopeptidase [Ruthenibacterium sp.]
MVKAKRTVLRIFFIVLVAAVLIGGALFYNYAATDETVVPELSVTLNDTPLLYDSLAWHTPVFDGLIYKDYAETVDKSDTVPALNAATFALRVPADYEAALTVRDSVGNALTAVTQPGEWKYTTVQNGVHTYDITVSAPRTGGSAYGEWHYSGRFCIDVAPAITLSSDSVTQGEILTVLVTGLGNLPLPEMEQNLSYAHFAKCASGYSAEIGVGYNVTPGTYVISVHCGELSMTKTIAVLPRSFERQDMTIDGDIIASTNTADASAQWRDAIWSLYETADDTVYWKDIFRSPVDCDVVNTSYGLFRYTNGGSTPDRHAGVDFDSDEGDPVYAPNNGRVVYAGFLTLTGNTVVIEHGAGLKSYIFHMKTLHCAKGDMVKTGELIGEVGSTGYSTGPHMHYEVKIGRQSIDPLPLLDGTSGLYLVS